MSDLFAELPQVVWKSISEIAAMRGVRKSAVHKQVERFEREGRITTRRVGRERQVDLAAYQRAVGEAGDAYREQAAETAKATATPKALRDAQTEKAQWEARGKALEVSERLGALVPIKGENGIEQAMVRSASAIVRALDQMPGWAGDFVTAARDGEAGTRRLLREKRDELRKAIAVALTQLEEEGAAAEADGYDVDLAD